MIPKNQGKENSSNLVDEESKQPLGETQSGSPNKPSAIVGIIFFVVIITWTLFSNRKHPYTAEATRLVLCSE